MTTFPGSPKLIKGGIVLIDPETSAAKRIISLQYNPDSFSHEMQVKSAGYCADYSEALRLKGPPQGTIKLDVEIDATDRSKFPDQDPSAVQLGIQLHLASMRMQRNPLSTQVLGDEDRASPGTGNILAKEAARVRLTAARPLFPCLISRASNRQSNSIKAKQVDNITQIQHQS